MKRSEGIIKAYRLKNKKEPENQTTGKLWQTEYNNYTENCEYCHEKPKDFYTWLNETIIPVNP